MDRNDLFIDRKKLNRESFSLLFSTYYKDLILFAGTYIPDRMACEDIIQTVFMKLWNEREIIELKCSWKSYLLTSVRNQCLNELQHQNVVQEHVKYSQLNYALESFNTENYVLYSDLENHYKKALDKIPSGCREVYEMHKVKGLKYKEIAELTGLPVRTIESRIARTVVLLRGYLKDYLPVCVSVIITLQMLKHIIRYVDKSL